MPILVCPECRQAAPMPAYDDDPQGAVRCELTCPECWPTGSRDEVPRFWDGHGRELLYCPGHGDHGKPISKPGNRTKTKPK